MGFRSIRIKIYIPSPLSLASQQTSKTIGTIHGIAFVMIALILIENRLLTLQLKMLLSQLQMPPMLPAVAAPTLVFLEFLSSVIKFDSIFILFFLSRFQSNERNFYVKLNKPRNAIQF